MEYKELFEKALTEVSDRCTFSTDHEMAEKIAERAKNMKKEFTVQNNTHPSLIEADPVYQEPKKGTKIFHAVAGIAGTAAVLTGGFFGLRYLNEHGGLKEGGSDELRAGYSQNAAAATTAGEEQPEFTYIFQAYSSDGLAAESDNNAEYTTVAEITPVETVETTVTTEVSDITTTATAEWTDDTTYNIPQVQITDGMLDHTDVTLALGEGNVKILPGRIYDGRILKLKLEGSEEDTRKIMIRSVSNPRNIMLGVGEYNSDGTRDFWALICVPEGETDTLELLDTGTLKTEGKPKAIEVINISGIKDYEPLTERVGVDMTQFGMPDETLEWLWLSPFGLELSFTSDTNWKSPNINVEWTTLNGTVCKSRGYSGTEDYDESTGKYHENLLIVPDEDTDLTEMKEFSINGLKTKRAEFMPRSFWDIPEDDSLTMTPVETAVHIAAPEE